MKYEIEWIHGFWGMDFVMKPKVLLFPLLSVFAKHIHGWIHFLPTFRSFGYSTSNGIGKPFFSAIITLLSFFIISMR